MIHKLYEDFLDEPKVYHACEQFWRELSTTIAHSVGSVGSAADWHSWIPRSYADGTPMELDGNPIWDGRSDQLGRGYRIIQDRAQGDGIEIAAWLKTYEEEDTEMPGEELFIYLSLSAESVSLAEALLRKWMSPGTTREDMRAFIAEMIPSNLEPPDPAK